MTGHTTYLKFLPGVSQWVHLEDWPNWEKFISACVLGLVLFAIGRLAAGKILTASQRQEALVPAEKLNFFGFFDFFIEGFVNFYDSILGKENRSHLPFVASIFIFILSANLIGLIPGVPAITTTVWVTVAMALVVFVYFNWYGVKEHGAIGYLKHFCGPVWWLACLMFPLEILSTTLRVLTLNLRLYWNITADHIVVGIFTDLLGPILPVIFYVLGAFICFMQAFVFTTLTMIYVLLATQHEEEHE